MLRSLALVVLLGTRSYAGEVIARPNITIVPNGDQLRHICNSADHLYGCTAFRARVETACELTGSRVRMHMAIEMTPLVYLWNTSYLHHESLHIDDIRQAVTAYIGEVESRTYATQNECVRDAHRETAEFRNTLDHFLEDSNAKRHPEYVRRLSHVVIVK